MIYDAETLAETPLPVLQVTPGLVEWYVNEGAGAIRYGKAIPKGPGPVEQARAAVQARKSAGGGSRRCVLVLGRERIPDRLLSLPALKPREAQAILKRKAAGLCSSEDSALRHVLFHARPCTRASATSEDEQKAVDWHLVAMDRQEVTGLRVALRSHRLQVKRVVAEQLAPLALAQATGEDPNATFLSVRVDESGVAVHLVSDEAVVSHSHMEGSPSVDPNVASSLLHEVRSMAGFWKKESRGGQVARVVIMGLAYDRGTLLANAVQAALPEVDVYLLPGKGHAGGDPLVGRYTLLGAASIAAPISPDLSHSLPPSRLAVFGAMAAGFLVAGLVGWELNQQVEVRRRALGSEVATISVRLDELRGVEKLSDEAAEAARELDRTAARLGAIGVQGLELRSILTDVFGSFLDRAALVSARIERDNESGFEMRIEGHVDGPTTEVLVRLRRLCESLDQSPHFDQVELVLSDRLPETQAGELPFSLVLTRGGVETG